MNSEVAWVDVIRFSVEFERRQNGTGQKSDRKRRHRAADITRCYETGVVRSE